MENADANRRWYCLNPRTTCSSQFQSGYQVTAQGIIEIWVFNHLSVNILNADTDDNDIISGDKNGFT